MSDRTPAAVDPPTRLVTFHLAGELWAVEIDLVEEVVGAGCVLPLPDMPPELAGLLRLRGELLPVLHLAPALGVQSGEAGDVLILRFAGIRTGVLVDAAYQAASLPREAIRPASSRGEPHDGVLGVASWGDAILTVIDPQAVLARSLPLTSRASP